METHGGEHRGRGSLLNITGDRVKGPDVCDGGHCDLKGAADVSILVEKRHGLNPR